MDDRHYASDYEWWEQVGVLTVRNDEPVPTCPECGGLVRRDLDEQQGWRCDIHGPCVPEWVDDDEEDEE